MPEPTAEDTIPVNAPVSAPATDGSSPAASILVVDDDDNVRAFIRRVLQDEQFAVIDFNEGH